MTCPEVGELSVLNEMTVVKALLTGRTETALFGSKVGPNISPTVVGYGKFAITTVTRTLSLRTPIEGETDCTLGTTRLNVNGNVTIMSG